MNKPSMHKRFVRKAGKLSGGVLLKYTILYRDCKCGRPFGQRDWAFTPSGGSDMEIQKAMLFTI